MSFSEINYLTVIVAGVVYMFIGGMWYSPLLFSNYWLRVMKLKEDEIERNPLEFGLVFVGCIITAFFVSLFAHNIYADPNLGEGVTVGVVAWLGFMATASYTYTVFEGPPLRAWVLYAGYMLVSLVAVGAIITF